MNIFGEPMRVRARGGVDRRAERTCRPAGAAGLDGAGGADAEEGVSGAWRAGCDAGVEGEDRREYKLEVVCPKRGDRFEVG